MKRFMLRDGSFPTAKSATLAGENLGQEPTYFEWVRQPDPSLTESIQTIFFTDICLTEALQVPDNITKVAWLIEPSEISPDPTKFVLEHQDLFDYILTWRSSFVGLSDKWLFYPFGGSWVKNWQIPNKNKLVSIIASGKNLTSGHRLRHWAVDRFSESVDVFGRGYNPIATVKQGLADYYFSIVIENIRENWWFTEKLINTFSLGTIPIYWGCPDIGKFFDTDGILQFEDSMGLKEILDSLTVNKYHSRVDSVIRNFDKAGWYRCVEDWLWVNHPFLFNGH